MLKEKTKKSFVCSHGPVVRRTLHSNVATTLPARLRHARDQALRGEFAKRQPRDFEPANERAAAARHFATVHHPRRAGVARKLRQTGVILLRFELGAERGVLLHRRALTFVAIDPGCLCHKGTRNLVANFRFSTCFWPCDFARPQRLSLAQGRSCPGAGRRTAPVRPEIGSDCRSSVARFSPGRRNPDQSRPRETRLPSSACESRRRHPARL